MSDDLEQRLHDHAVALDVEAPPIGLEEVMESDPEPLRQRTVRSDPRDARRWFAAAAAVVLVAGAIVVLATMAGREPRSNRLAPLPVPGNSGLAASTGVSESSPPWPTVTGPPSSPSVVIPPTVVSTTPVTASTASSPTLAPPAEPESITVDEVRQHQTAALGALSGFSATSVRPAGTLPSADRADEDVAVRFTILADGSFYAQAGPGLWGSYDPASGIVRGAYVTPDGHPVYEETVGQSDSSVSVNILVGHVPTTIIESSPEARQSVEEQTVDGRSGWMVTTVSTYPAASSAQTTQTMHQFVDRETGLVTFSSLVSSDPNVASQQSTLSDLEVVETLPDGFPGSFPDGATVARSGDPNAASMITPRDAIARFGIPLPLPTNVADTRIRYSEQPVPVDAAAPSPGEEPELLLREVFVAVSDTFVPLTIQVTAAAAVAGKAVFEHSVVVDGYQCGDQNDDGECDTNRPADYGVVEDTPGTTTPPRQIELDGGALAGSYALVREGSVSVTVGPLNIGITSPDTKRALELANDLTWVAP